MGTQTCKDAARAIGLVLQGIDRDTALSALGAAATLNIVNLSTPAEIEERADRFLASMEATIGELLSTVANTGGEDHADY